MSEPNTESDSEQAARLDPAPWSLVHLKDHTDTYRTYTYGGSRIYVGVNSDTVRDDQTSVVLSILPNN